jgi:hypothetical protein
MSYYYGSIEDSSDNMVGAVRVLEKNDGHELHETVTEWSAKERFLALSIDKGGPGFLSNEPQSMIVSFRIREEEEKVYVDMIADLKLKTGLCVLAPLLKVVLPKKLAGIADGIADLKEE